jgi:asparagine synthase (glutamine-hydrolysing)
MCGIFGVLHPCGDLDREMLSMRAVLRHRGPDGEGIERVPHGILGHVRLSVIDLSVAAAQPLWDAQRLVCVTYNGEIYNFRELRDECRRAGMEFRSSSDTEVIVQQYLLHGVDAFDRLNGIFALCLYDARGGEFFLVRDPMGVKPLYYGPSPQGLFFASELKGLIRSGCFAPEVDPAALQAYLQLDLVPAPLSMIRGVRKLPGGHCLRVDRTGRAELHRYTTLDDGPQESHGRIGNDVTTFDHLIHRVIERQMVADVPVGVFLSGGIDSSIVARVAADVAPSRLSTFSIGFDDRSFDESEYFAIVAKEIGSDHHCETLTATAMLDILPMIPEVACEPLADGSILPTYLLSRFTRRYVTVALSGDGADELFAGYPTYRAARWGACLSHLPRPMRSGLLQLAHTVLPVNYDNFSLDFRVKKFLSGLHPDLILRNERWLGTFLPEELPDLLQAYDQSLQRDLEIQLHEPSKGLDAHWLEALLRTDQRFYLQDGVLVKVDRASMASALEVRVPYLDAEVVRFARRLPPDRKLRGAGFKHLLKRYAKGRLPEAILARSKKGFGAPLGKWFRFELKDLLQDTLESHKIEAQGFFRSEFVSRLLTEHWNGHRDHRKQLFNLLTFTLWYDHVRGNQATDTKQRALQVSGSTALRVDAVPGRHLQSARGDGAVRDPGAKRALPRPLCAGS